MDELLNTSHAPASGTSQNHSMNELLWEHGLRRAEDQIELGFEKLDTISKSQINTYPRFCRSGFEVEPKTKVASSMCPFRCVQFPTEHSM